jgi:hypothetical protein
LDPVVITEELYDITELFVPELLFEPVGVIDVLPDTLTVCLIVTETLDEPDALA